MHHEVFGILRRYRQPRLHPDLVRIVQIHALFPKRHDLVSQLFDVGEYRHSAPPENIDQFVADSVPSFTASALYAAQVSSAFHLGSDELVSQPDALTVRAIEGGLQFCLRVQVLYDDIGATLDLDSTARGEHFWSAVSSTKRTADVAV